MAGLTSILKKGFFLLIFLFLYNFIVGRYVPYLVPISIESLSLSSFTSLNVIVSVLVYILVAGILVEQVDRRVS